MSSELRDIYQELILEHAKNPRNFGPLAGATHTATGHNPLCGDRLVLQLYLDGDIVTDVRFSGDGCAISRSSASLLTTIIKGHTRAEALEIFHAFHLLVTGKWPAGQSTESLGKLAVFAGVAEFPMRVKCASLPWHTLDAALGSAAAPVSTE